MNRKTQERKGKGKKRIKINKRLKKKEVEKFSFFFHRVIVTHLLAYEKRGRKKREKNEQTSVFDFSFSNSTNQFLLRPPFHFLILSFISLNDPSKTLQNNFISFFQSKFNRTEMDVKNHDSIQFMCKSFHREFFLLVMIIIIKEVFEVTNFR